MNKPIEQYDMVKNYVNAILDNIRFVDEFKKGKDFHYVEEQKRMLGKEYLRDEIENKMFVYTMCSPLGIFYYNIRDILNFCKETNLNYKSLFKIISYNKKKKNFVFDFNGWKIFVEKYKRLI